MSTDFTHIIMTRFNLATPGRESRLRNRPGWLEERLVLFQRYCLPSVAGQTERRFHWVIYFDKDTPAAIRDRVEGLRTLGGFIPYYTGLFPAEGWPRSLHELFGLETGRVLTTRLDNDDALALDHVARLHSAVRQRGHERGAYNFTRGCILHRGRLYGLTHPTNAFFSWLDHAGPGLRTAPNIQHMDIANHGPVHQIGGPAAWMQVVHGGNVSNRVRGRRIRPAALQGSFPPEVTATLAPAGRLAVAMENALLTPVRAGRDWAITALHARRGG